MGLNGRKRACCHEVVHALQHRHTKCCKDSKAVSYLDGRTLNKYYGIDQLKENKDYNVCYSISYILRNYKPPRRSPVTVRRYKRERCSQRIRKKDAIPNIQIKTKTVHVKYDCFSETISMEKDKILNDEQASIEKKIRCNKDELLSQQILDAGKQFTKPYNQLSLRERTRRRRKLFLLLVASCLDKKVAKTKNMNKYLFKNKNLVCEVVSLLDDLRLDLQMLTKVNVSSITQLESLPSPDVAEDKSSASALANIIYNESSQAAYSRIRSELIKHPNIQKEDVPSSYMLAKKRPAMEAFVVVPDADAVACYNTANMSINKTNHTEVSILPKIEYTPSSFIQRSGAIKIDFTESYEKLKESSAKKGEIMAARITGGFEKICNLMVEKHVTKKRKINGEVLVIDSYDGAVHNRSKTGDSSIISFSSQLVSSSLLKHEGVSAGNSLNILTWQQVICSEKSENVFPAIKEHYGSKKIMRERKDEMSNGIKFIFKEVHNGKMLYLLTQHSLFTRKHRPFLLCSCGRGVGVKNPDHECKLLTEIEQTKYWERSLRRWKRKREKDPSYQYFDHMDFVDKENEGISHFGLHPNILPRDSIAFDVFHLRCAITRRLMGNLQTFMLKQSVELIQEFAELILAEFWSPYNILVWNLHKTFQSFIGSELMLFIRYTKNIVGFLRDKFNSTPTLEALCNGLSTWEKITPFLVITTIENKEEHERNVLVFEKNIKAFYAAGAKTFLTKNNIGDDETFYLHCLRFYIPKIAKQTFEQHNMGIGIFTMQGFERRNKESKNVLKRFSNNRGNIALSNLKRLFDIFQHDHNKV